MQKVKWKKPPQKKKINLKPKKTQNTYVDALTQNRTENLIITGKVVTSDTLYH